MAFCSALFASAFGTMAAVALQGTRGPVRVAFDMLIYVAVMIPRIVIGIATLIGLVTVFNKLNSVIVAIWPAGFLLSFTFSFDDFIIAFFVVGSETTLPIYVFSSIRRGVTPEINAIGTMVMGVSLLLLISAQLLLKRERRKSR